MPDRFTTSLLLANIVLLNASYAQKTPCPPVSTAQIVSDVVVQGASRNDDMGAGLFAEWTGRFIGSRAVVI